MSSYGKRINNWKKQIKKGININRCNKYDGDEESKNRCIQCIKDKGYPKLASYPDNGITCIQPFKKQNKLGKSIKIKDEKKYMYKLDKYMKDKKFRDEVDKNFIENTKVI